MNELLKELQTRISKTKNARFMASKRMRRNNILASLASPLLSTYIIAISLLQFQPKPVLNPVNFSILTISLSVASLVISLLIQNRRYGDLERNYHSCGEELSSLYDKVATYISCGNVDKQTADDLFKEYHDILLNHNLNHSTIDFLIGDKTFSFYHIWWFLYAPSTLYFCFIVLPPILFFLFRA